ncbi:MAG TPA: hypothetical protein VJV22_06455 [Acidobacteriaceae bacterium]|nr:hypothetical protein [Acidobacteriaceae bacterium]
MQFAIRRTIALVVTATAAACADGTTAPKLALDGGPQFTKSHSNGDATLSVASTATGFFETRLSYDWTLTKRVKSIMDMTPDGAMYELPSTSELEIPAGQVRWIEYEISAQRSPAVPTTSTGVRGQVCVTNAGSAIITDPQIVSLVQSATTPGNFTDVASSPVGVNAKESLGPGESYCYPYETTFTRVAGALYRTTASVTVASESGHPASGAVATASATSTPVAFSVPSTVSQGEPVDASALAYDGMNVNSQQSRSGPCAEHFYLWWCSTDTEHDPWQFWGSGTVSFVVDQHNFFSCGESFDFTNAAVLVEGGTSINASHTRHQAQATIRLASAECAPNPGCTLTQGYWKQPFHIWPDQRDGSNWIRNDVEFFDSGITWQQTLDTPTRGDAYLILAHQYIAATLNRANGARMDNLAQVADAYAAAAHWFSLSPDQRALTSRDTLISWANVLESFNSGSAGVPHCAG